MKKIIPRGKWILVKQDDEKSRQSEHGIVTPDDVDQERKAFGTVLSIGPEIKDIKDGDRIVYGAYSGEQIKVRDGDKEIDYVLVLEEDIIAFIRE